MRTITALLVGLACVIQLQAQQALRYDLVIRGGHVMDPETGLDGPQSAGTFARVIAQYVRSERRLSMMDAIRKMSLMPAQLLERATAAGQKKGRLQEGKDADVVIFDPRTVADRATDQSPEEPSVGVEFLLVNGTVVVANGERKRRRAWPCARSFDSLGPLSRHGSRWTSRTLRERRLHALRQAAVEVR